MLRSRRTDQRALARIKKVESAAVTSGWYFASCVAAEKHVNCQHFRCSSASLCTASRGLTSRVVNNISHVENIIDLLKSFSTIPQVTWRVKHFFLPAGRFIFFGRLIFSRRSEGLKIPRVSKFHKKFWARDPRFLIINFFYRARV